MNAPNQRAAEIDASNRAWRTLLQGLTVDVLVAVALALTVATAAGIEWTDAYWAGLGLAVAKSGITAAVSFFARLVVPPPTTPTTRAGVAA